MAALLLGEASPVLPRPPNKPRAVPFFRPTVGGTFLAVMTRCSYLPSRDKATTQSRRALPRAFHGERRLASHRRSRWSTWVWCGSRLALSSEPSQEAATILRSFWEVHAVSWDLFVVGSGVFGFVRDFELSTAVDACLGRLHDGGVDLRDQRSCQWHGVHLRGVGAEWCGLGSVVGGQ